MLYVIENMQNFVKNKSILTYFKGMIFKKDAY